jgi:hypothetical protein
VDTLYRAAHRALQAASSVSKGPGPTQSRVRIQPAHEQERREERLGAPTVPTPAPANPDALRCTVLRAHPAPVATPPDEPTLTVRTRPDRRLDLLTRRRLAGRREGARPYPGVSPCFRPSRLCLGGEGRFFLQRIARIVPPGHPAGLLALVLHTAGHDVSLNHRRRNPAAYPHLAPR